MGRSLQGSPANPAPPASYALKARAIVAWGNAPGFGCMRGGLKARATVAWGEAPGCRHAATRGLKACAKCPHRREFQSARPTFDATSIPNKPLIERHAILRKHRSHLALKIAPPMVFRLPIDIPHQRCPIAQPHRKRRIPALPRELRKLRPFRLNPLRRRNLQPLDHLRHGLRPRDKQRNMDVITHPTHPHANILGPNRRRQNRMHLASNSVAQKRPSPLRAEDQMHQYVRDRLRHATDYSADPQSAPVTATTSWGCAPGHPNAGLQPAMVQTSKFSKDA